MPDSEVAGTSPASPEHLDRLLFKSHKSLPRRSNTLLNGHVAHGSALDQNRHAVDGVPYATVPGLPLTPPGLAQDESPTGTDIPKAAASSHSVVGVLTPSKPSHPPTPETTPPRGLTSSYRPGLNHLGYTSCSSRAESFQTACEMMSDAETETPRRSSQSLLLSSTQRKIRRDGGLESPQIGSGARVSVVDPSGMKISGVKDRELSSTTTPRLGETSNNFEIHKKPARDATKRSRDISDVGVPDLDAPTRVKSLRNRAGPEDSLSMEQFRNQIGWPTSEERPVSGVSDDSRRFSAVSTSSTIEAMIIDAPRPAKRSLRHTVKKFSLRSASSPITKSERMSLASHAESQHRLSHKAARITESDRRSIASEISISGSSTVGVPHMPVDVVPVVVIPERRSSLKSCSSATSRNPSQTRSRPSSRRAPTLPGSRPGSLDIPRHRQRTLSDPHANTTISGTDFRGRSSGRPYIPPRSSSLSAPTSQNNSRTTSLTSESLRSHTLATEKIQMQEQSLDYPPEPQQPPPAPPQARGREKYDVAEVGKTQSILIGVEDMSHLRSPSITYPQHSIPSSSPGPFEIDEARTVTFFPHNNESLLLVEPQGHSGLRGQMPMTDRLVNPDQPHTPDIPRESESSIDSPLRNPRPPPPPPVTKATPPAPDTEADRLPKNLDSNPEVSNGPSRRFESMRRAWVSRPRSESFNSLARSFSLTGARNPKAGQNVDGISQPFWRPRRFWDDSPGAGTPAESPETEYTPPTPDANLDQYISNSLGMPQKRIVFEGPPLPTTRTGAKRRLDGSSPYHHATRSTLVESRIFTPEALYSQTSLHQRQFPAVSWWRFRLRSGIVRTLRRRLRRSMQQRAEGKREARREKLKQSIGEAVLVNSSTQVQVRKPAPDLS